MFFRDSFLFFSAAVAFSVWASVASATYSTSGLVDVPTDEYLGHLQLEFDFTTAFSPDDTVPNYGCLNVNVGVYELAEFGIAVNSFWEEPAFLGNAKFEAIDEEHFWKYQPGLSIGVDKITTSSEVSSAGTRYASDDEAYGRPFNDKLSFYVVSTKHLSPLGVFHLGWGRGRFVGYGPYSKYFHGIFLGFERTVYGPVSLTAEADGRDVNVGARLNFGRVAVVVAGEKLEQIGRGYSPYFSVSLETSTDLLHFRTGERLRLRRKANELKEDIAEALTAVLLETSHVDEMRGQLTELEKEYKRAGVDTRELDRMRRELEELRARASEALREARGGI